jgi:hypothetical protein
MRRTTLGRSRPYESRSDQFRRVSPRRQRDVLCDVMLCAAACESWLTLKELSRMTGYGEASISAQLRHLRKPEFGGFVVQKRCREEEPPDREGGHGAVWEYRLLRGLGRRPGKRIPWLTPTILRGVIRAAKEVQQRSGAEL